MSSVPPLTVVVTPAYQGAEHVAACIASVRRQGYDNWRHIVVDNASTDGMGDVVSRVAGGDDRVQYVRYDEHVDMLSNWNRALELVPDNAVYVRQLNVDDVLEPHCLATSVGVAERFPEAAIVSSYHRNGTRIHPRGVRHREVVCVEGRDVVRNLFLGGPDYLAQPSVLLMRRAAMHGWPHLFTPVTFPAGLSRDMPMVQADKEGFLATLARSQLVFVPDHLVNLRVDVDSLTGYAWRVSAWHVGWLELLLRHGDEFLSADEFKVAMRRILVKYGRTSAWRRLRRDTRHPEYVEYHERALTQLIPALSARGFDREARALRVNARLLGSASASRVHTLTASTEARTGGLQ